MGDMSQSFGDGYRWNEGDTKVVIKQLLHGLAIMHREGITHRDLKPEVCTLLLLKSHYHNLTPLEHIPLPSRRSDPCPPR